MRHKPAVVTDLPPSPEDERHGRMLKYAIAMGIRVVCIGACLFVDGWWLLVPALGAVVLPWIAVTLATIGAPRDEHGVERPGVIERFIAGRRA